MVAWCGNGWQLKLIEGGFEGFKLDIGMRSEGA